MKTKHQISQEKEQHQTPNQEKVNSILFKSRNNQSRRQSKAKQTKQNNK